MKTLTLSRKSDILRPSPTLGITGKANAMKAEGKDVVSFAAGEPDFNTPEPICRAAIEAIEAGFTKYTPSAGIPALKQAISAKLQRENHLQYDPSQIVVSCGAKHSIYNSIQVLVDPGDEVILFAPYWMTYYDQIVLAGGVPKIVQTSAESGFIPTREQIETAVTSKTRAILINSPSNPTGAVFGHQTLKEIAHTAIRHGLWVISDEIYERLVYGGEYESFASLGKDIFDQTITVGGCSKSYAMTGWRIGFAAVPLPVANAMSNFQDQVTSNPTSFAQKGAVAAFGLPAESIEQMRVEFQARRDLILRKLREIPGVSVNEPQGAFYVLPDFSHYIGTQYQTDFELADALLNEAEVAAIPGSVFSANGHLRLSYATSRAQIEKGVDRIHEFLSKKA